ncbi:MAG TPA: glycosyltransferase family 87 protein [Solirubrobacterales bacterium]|nr:glycosyltransferase family 87 protein [Solirubrobacterales bacterium]
MESTPGPQPSLRLAQISLAVLLLTSLLVCLSATQSELFLDIAANVTAYRLVAAASSLVLIGLVWRAASLRGLSPVRAAVLVGLNPVIVLYGVGGGHNDLMMLAILAAGLYVLLQRRERRGGALIVTATAVKLTAGPLLPFALAGRRRGEGAARLRLAVGAALGGVAVAALAFAFFGTAPLQLPVTLQGIQAEGGPHSIVGFLLAAVGVEPIPRALGVGLTLVFLAIVAWLLRRSGAMRWTGSSERAGRPSPSSSPPGFSSPGTSPGSCRWRRSSPATVACSPPRFSSPASG